MYIRNNGLENGSGYSDFFTQVIALNRAKEGTENYGVAPLIDAVD